MNAGRDVERLISTWLTEEAANRSRDRVLLEVGQSIRRQPQRRFGAAWRNPVYISTMRVAALAAAIVVALAGAAWIGRSTASNVAAPSGTAAPSNAPYSPPAVTLGSYTAARNEICVRYRSEINPLRPDLEGMYDAGVSSDRWPAAVAALGLAADRLEALANELRGISAPPEIEAEHRTDVANWDATVVLIRAALAKIDAGDIAGAQANDQSADIFGERIVAFEANHGLLACP